MTQGRRLARASLWTLSAILALIPIQVPQAQGSSSDHKQQPGCPFKVVREQVEKIFGKYDNAMHSGGEIAGGEVPNVVKVEHLSLYTCAFQRKSGEVLQFIANLYPEAAAADAGFDRASKVKNANGAFYTSQRQIGPVKVFEGPGHAMAHQNTQVVMAHWLVIKDGKPVPADVPGSRLTPLLQAWLSATGEK